MSAKFPRGGANPFSAIRLLDKKKIIYHIVICTGVGGYCSKFDYRGTRASKDIYSIIIHIIKQNISTIISTKIKIKIY